MRKLRRKFKRPKRPWDTQRIKDERKLMKEYGLMRKRELWKSQEILRNFRGMARDLIAVENPEKEKVIIEKLMSTGLLTEGKGLDDILALNVRNILDRRLQTLVWRRGMALTPKEARMRITHGKIAIGGRRMKFPSYLVGVEEERKIHFYGPRVAK